MHRLEARHLAGCGRAAREQLLAEIAARKHHVDVIKGAQPQQTRGQRCRRDGRTHGEENLPLQRLGRPREPTRIQHGRNVCQRVMRAGRSAREEDGVASTGVKVEGRRHDIYGVHPGFLVSIVGRRGRVRRRRLFSLSGRPPPRLHALWMAELSGSVKRRAVVVVAQVEASTALNELQARCTQAADRTLVQRALLIRLRYVVHVCAFFNEPQCLCLFGSIACLVKLGAESLRRGRTRRDGAQLVIAGHIASVPFQTHTHKPRRGCEGGGLRVAVHALNTALRGVRLHLPFAFCRLTACV